MNLTQAKQLRTRMTDAESRLWYRLRAHRFAGIKFKRQVPLGRFVVDFVCFEHKLVIEVDGGQHATSSSDGTRDAWLQSPGFQVLRFWNNDVLKNTDTVLTKILETFDRSQASPSPDALRASPSPTRGEGKKDATSDQM
jgi:very-short-patch-repair endonuclease